MEKIFIYLHNDMTDLSLIERYMGFYHKFFASSLDPSYSYVLDLYIDNFLAGQAIIYYIRGGLRGVGVVYYVVVDERFRGRGLGKILVSSAEQIFEDLNLDFSIATASIDNVVSHRMFKSLSYDEEDLERISRICSHQIQEMILKLSCGYEDDLLFYKDLRRPAYENNIKSLCKTINQLDKDVVERHWLRSCYRPWRSYRSLIKL